MAKTGSVTVRIGDKLRERVNELTREALAEAWDQGYASGHSNAMRRMSDEPNAPTTLNPYTVEGDL